ncbi:MAG: hypothetical protein H7070_00385 [Saprospiraceae bacterium]|nr:hypothetical protein [Pyrinomonadaceae bacterium]
MSIEETKLTAEVGSVRELNLYLISGWVLILSYCKHSSDTQNPRFVVAWQSNDEPVVPELLDEWELSEIDKQRYR